MKSKCATCKWKEWSEKNPGKWLAKLWKWHTGWCPGWKAYQRELALEAARPPEAK